MVLIAYRLLAILAPRIPRPLGLRIAARAGGIAARLARHRRAVRANLSHVVDPALGPRELQRLTERVFANQARNYFDMFHFAGRPLRELATITRYDSLLAAIDALAGRGAVAVTLHYGNLDVVAQSIAMSGIGVSAAVERLQPEALFLLVSRLRSRTGLELVPVDRATLRLLRALREGRLVVLAADRDVTGTALAMPFFGRPASVPDGYARLAVLADVPVLVCRSRRMPDDTFELSIERIIEPPRDIDRKSAVRAVIAETLLAFEQVVREEPGQWVLFHGLWNTSRPKADDLCSDGSIDVS